MQKRHTCVCLFCRGVWLSFPNNHFKKMPLFGVLTCDDTQGGYKPRWIRRTWWVPRKERNEQICEVTSYHQDVKWHDESSFLSCGESIALNEIYQNIISGRQKHMYKNYTYVGVITPKLIIIIIYNKTKVNIIDKNYVKQLRF